MILVRKKVQSKPSLVVSVNLLGTNGAKDLGAKRVAASNSLAVDVGSAEPSELAVGSVDNSQNSVGGGGLGDVTPRDAVVAAGLVAPGLGGGVAAGHADDGAVLGVAVGDNVEVVVAAGVAVDAVAGQVVQGPGLAVDLLRVGAGGGGVGARGQGCGGGGAGFHGGGAGVDQSASGTIARDATRIRVCRVALVGRSACSGSGRRGDEGERTADFSASGTGRVGVGRVASICRLGSLGGARGQVGGGR